MFLRKFCVFLTLLNLHSYLAINPDHPLHATHRNDIKHTKRNSKRNGPTKLLPWNLRLQIPVKHHIYSKNNLLPGSLILVCTSNFFDSGGEIYLQVKQINIICIQLQNILTVSVTFWYNNSTRNYSSISLAYRTGLTFSEFVRWTGISMSGDCKREGHKKYH